MLIRFNVKNFLSIYELQEFSMLAGDVRGKDELLTIKNDIKILKYASLYGANASGKSNLIKAIYASRNCILRGIKNSKVTEQFCKLNTDYKKQETYFDFEFLIDDQVYSYGFTAILSEEIITGEWLYKLSKKNQKLIFTRDVSKQKYEYDKKLFNTDNITKFKVWIEDSMMQNNSLLLTEIFNKNSVDLEFKLFSNIYKWFRDKIFILFPNTCYNDFDRLVQNDSSLLKMLERLDTGIRTIEQEVVDVSKLPNELKEGPFLNMIKTNLKKIGGKSLISNPLYLFSAILGENDDLEFKKIVFNHVEDGNSVLLDYCEESDGTRRIIELIQAINLSQKEGKTLIVDEIERSLHPILIESILEHFISASEKFNSQLIITTHDQRLLNSEKIRKDSIWFVEKDYLGHSKFNSLDEYKTRNDLKIEKAYLEGRFGAIPVISDLEDMEEDI